MRLRAEKRFGDSGLKPTTVYLTCSAFPINFSFHFTNTWPACPLGISAGNYSNGSRLEIF